MVENSKQSTARRVAYGAISISLCMLSLLLFRGATSILSAVSIPLILCVFHDTTRLKQDYLQSSLTLMVLTVILFPLQTIFVTSYWIMSAVLGKVTFFVQGKLKKKNFINYIVLVALVLFFSMAMSERLLDVPLVTMMYRISGGMTTIFIGILLTEAVFIAGVHIYFKKLLRDRQL